MYVARRNWGIRIGVGIMEVPPLFLSDPPIQEATTHTRDQKVFACLLRQY